MSRGGALRGARPAELIAVFNGIGFGLISLIYWYTVAGNAGFTATAAAALYVPILGFQLHHEIYGVGFAAIGLYLMSQDNLAVKTLGGYLFGLGLAWFGDDFIQHCPGGNVFGCQNWP